MSEFVLNCFNKVKTISFLLMVIVLPLTAQTVKKTYHDYGKTKLKEDYQVNSNGLKNGYYKSYSKEGLLIYSYNFVNGKENGLCVDYAGERSGIASNVGLAKTCFGKPMLERQFSNGLLLWEKFYDCIDGNQILVFKKSKKDDYYEYVEFYSSGKVKEKYNTKDNYKYKGEYLKYHSNGQISEKGYYDNGKVGTWVGLNENGDSSYIARFEFGFETSYKGFHSNGKVAFVSLADPNFESLEKVDYDSSGNKISFKQIRCYPFIYDCSEPKPKNRKEYAASKATCGNLMKNPFLDSESYCAKKVVFNESGDTVSVNVNLLIQAKDYGYNDSKYILIDSLRLQESIKAIKESMELTLMRNRNTSKLKTISETYKANRRARGLIDLLVRHYASRYFNLIEINAKEKDIVWNEYHYFLIRNIPSFEDIRGKMQSQYWVSFVKTNNIENSIVDSTIFNVQGLFPNETVRHSNGSIDNPMGVYKKNNFITVGNFERLNKLQINDVVNNVDFNRPYGAALNVKRIENSTLNSIESLRKDGTEIDKLAEKLSFIFLDENKDLLKELQNISDVSILVQKLGLN